MEGGDSGVSEMAGREWYWWLDSQPTEVPAFYRVEIDVALDAEDRGTPLFSLVAFLNGDLQSLPEVPDEGG